VNLIIKNISIFTVFFVIISIFISCENDSNSVEEIEINNEYPEITDFSFLKVNNPGLKNNVFLDIDGDKISGRITEPINVSNLIATVDHKGSVILADNVVQEASITRNNFNNIINYTVKTSDNKSKSYEVDVVRFTNLPIVFINTNESQPIVSKDDYVEGTVHIDGGRNFDSKEQSAIKIRGRGNSTWWVHPKKPYQMKFDDKTSMLNMADEKKWIFLAEYSDKTMLRNTIAFELGYISKLDWTPKSTFAEVVVNNEYTGTYNISEKVEEGESRVNISKEGFLLEIDQYDRLDFDDVYFNTNNFLINIKEPDLEFNDVKFIYIKDLINNFENALNSPQFRDPSIGYSKYIDIDSFIDWYLISEITKNQDSKEFSSIYLNVDESGIIKMGPLWDFDLAFGNVNYSECEFTSGFWVKHHKWYSRLFEDRNFVNKVKSRFVYFKQNKSAIIQKIDEYANQLKLAQQENDNVWNTLGIYVWPNPVYYSTYEEEVEHLKNWYSERMNWLDQAINEL